MWTFLQHLQVVCSIAASIGTASTICIALLRRRRAAWASTRPLHQGAPPQRVPADSRRTVDFWDSAAATLEGLFWGGIYGACACLVAGALLYAGGVILLLLARDVYGLAVKPLLLPGLTGMIIVSALIGVIVGLVASVSEARQAAERRRRYKASW